MNYAVCFDGLNMNGRRRFDAVEFCAQRIDKVQEGKP
jgi:hypothetical protein